MIKLKKKLGIIVREEGKGMENIESKYGVKLNLKIHMNLGSFQSLFLKFTIVIYLKKNVKLFFKYLKFINIKENTYNKAQSFSLKNPLKKIIK
jgi:hypothetical protein